MNSNSENHTWRYDAEGPYQVCAECHEVRDMNGNIVRRLQHPPQHINPTSPVE